MLRAEASTALGPAARLDLAVEVAAGECLALTGPSGAGKSSVVRLVAGLLRPREGAVRCAGDVWLDTARGIDRPPEERRCGVVFQDHALFAHLSAWRNVAYPLRGLPRAQRRERALELLARFGLAGHADARPATLSGGERQRVALARALAREPRVLLLDEPLSSLDTRTRAGAVRELREVLGSVGVPSVLVTHDFEEAAELADRIAVLDAGRVVQTGTAAELAARPASSFVADLTGAVVLVGTATGAQDGLTVVALDGGGTAVSTDAAAPGPVAVTVHPWELSLARGTAAAGPAAARSPRNSLEAEVVTVTVIGNRARVGLRAGQPLAAEVTAQAARELELAPGARVMVTWKAAATRLVAR